MTRPSPQQWRRWFLCLLMVATLPMLACSSSSEDDSPPKKVASDDIIAKCEELIKDSCGALPSSLNFAYRPEAAYGLSTAKLCSDSCKAVVEGINCKGTEYEDLEEMFGPLGEACRAVTCFDTIKGPCDMTEARSDTPGLPLASCTESCVSAVQSEACKTSDDLQDDVNEECEWVGCLAALEPSCGPIDFIDSFGMDFGDPLVHSFMMQRAEQLCSSDCKEAFAKTVGSARVPGDCFEYDQLEEARSYLDKIVCSCYLPAKQECGDSFDLWFGTPGTSDLLAARSPPCCTEMANLACRLPPSFSFGDAEADSFPSFGSGTDGVSNDEDDVPSPDEQTTPEATPGAAEAMDGTEAGQANTNSSTGADVTGQSYFDSLYEQSQLFDANGLAYFENDDQMAHRIAQLHDGCFPSEAWGAVPLAPSSGASATARALPVIFFVALSLCLMAEAIMY